MQSVLVIDDDESLRDTIAVMRRGRLSPARPVAAWTAESILEEAVGGG